MINRVATAIFACVVILSLGVAYGVRTDRWGVPMDVVRVAEQLNAIPLEVDGWKGIRQEIGERQRKGAGALGFASRIYQNAHGRAVGVMIVCGRFGPICNHEPTACFTGSGQKQLRKEKPTSIEHGADQSSFYETDFEIPDMGQPRQRVFWGWSTDAKTWSSPESPRFAFPSYPYLYKLYFLTPIDPTENEKPVELDPEVVEFMKSFLVQLPGFLEPEPPATDPGDQ